MAQPIHYLDFEMRVEEGPQGYMVMVDSPVGEAREATSFPFGELELKGHLQSLEIALLRSGGTRRSVPGENEQAVQEFGSSLYHFLFPGQVHSLFVSTLREAGQKNQGVRVKLRFTTPELASLPWEFLYDDGQGQYICLSTQTPVVRYLERGQSSPPLAVAPPLRILGMIASPSGMGELNVQVEKQRVDNALAPLHADGLVELHWLEGQTWRDLMAAMNRGPWHIFHFIGHGAFDAQQDEGLIAFCDDQGAPHMLTASQLGLLLADHRPLRLVLLNACEGATGGTRDIYSSTASILMRRGVPAVIAMQYEITDTAAIEFTATFYASLADNLPVDAAVTQARKAINLGVNNSVEWGTPVLHMRSNDGQIFTVERVSAPASRPQSTPVPTSVAPAMRQISTTPQETTSTEPTTPAMPSRKPELVRYGVYGLVVIAALLGIYLIGTYFKNLTPISTQTTDPTITASQVEQGQVDDAAAAIPITTQATVIPAATPLPTPDSNATQVAAQAIAARLQEMQTVEARTTATFQAEQTVAAETTATFQAEQTVAAETTATFQAEQTVEAREIATIQAQQTAAANATATVVYLVLNGPISMAGATTLEGLTNAVLDDYRARGYIGTIQTEYPGTSGGFKDYFCSANRLWDVALVTGENRELEFSALCNSVDRVPLGFQVGWGKVDVDKANERYEPLYLFTTKAILASKPQVAAFIRYYLTHVNDLVPRFGGFYSSASASTLEQGLKALDESIQ